MADALSQWHLEGHPGTAWGAAFWLVVRWERAIGGGRAKEALLNARKRPIRFRSEARARAAADKANATLPHGVQEVPHAG